jgi:hypothetical protein
MTLSGTVAEQPAAPVPAGRAAASRGERAPRADVVVFATVSAILGVLRLVEMRSAGAPATVDSGNWIAWGEALFGQPSELEALGYPPLVPALTKISVWLFGLIDGIAILGALTSLAPGAGVFVALRRFKPGLSSAALALLVTASSSVGEATAWGGFPQLISFGALPLWLLALTAFLADPSPRTGRRAGLWLLAVAVTSHFALLVACTSGAGLCLANLPQLRGHPGLRSTALKKTAWVFVPSLWLVPTYLSLTMGILGNPDDSTSLTKLTWADLDDSIEFLYREAPWLWRLLLGAGAFAAVLIVRRGPVSGVAAIPLALTIGMAAAIALTREVRYLYLLPIIAVLWIGVSLAALDRSFRWRGALPALTAVLVVCAAVQVQRGVDFFDEQRGYYTVMTPSLLEAMEYIRDSTPADAIIATPSLGPDHPFGWWVEPVSGRRTIYGSPLRWLIFEDDVERAKIGNSIFSADFPNADTLDIARSAGVDYLLVPRRWVFFDDSDVDDLISTVGPAGVVRFDDADLIRLDQP